MLKRPWQAVRDGVDVKLLPDEQELYVLARSRARIDKERAMRQRKLKWLWGRLKELSAMRLKREELLMKLGAARDKATAAWRLVDIDLTPRPVLDKFAAIQMMDVHFPTTVGRTLILSRYTELNAEQKLLVSQLNLEMPPQPPPRITAAIAKAPAPAL